MEFIVYLVGFIIGVVLFLLLNQIFDIYYFGFKGIASTFMGCWFAGVIIVMFFGAFAKWIIIIGAVIWLLTKIFGNKGK